ncbi:BON domain-containing protein [Derxia gummosa]|uniref:Osmotically-inducible protein Y n=1 Tax=Derxia gummosa DSM 723 TaxID=1121388 RepID=A0A8B6XBV1_9BURK|nr:BON domain-containing protein [Derxia gummosa]
MNVRPGHAGARRLVAVLIAALAGAGLAACDRHESEQPKTLGQQVDGAVADGRAALDKAGAATDRAAERAGEQARELADDVRQAAGRAGDATADAAHDAKDKAGAAADATGRAATDTRITAEVKTALARAPEVKARDIKVETDDGRVRLQGEVETFAAREKAEQLAASTPGVRSVDSQLIVRQGKAS